MDKPLLIDRNAALNPQDSPCQTYGCRYYNPNISKDRYGKYLCLCQSR